MTHTIAHFSDLHLGYEAYAARSQRGHNQRGEDVVRALHRVVDDIVAADPPVVVCSGDVAELPQVPVRYMLAAGTEFQRLAGIRPDGSRRQLVVIAGNHDQSKHLRDGCFLELYRGLPGVHVVTSGYQRVEFTDADAPAELADTVVHALPHDSLRDLDQLGVAPVDGKVNVLTAHGVAESSELYRRAVGREFLIPAELLVMDWDYVALGHWHVQGPVFPLGVKRRSSKVWYAGSIESIDFGDVRGSGCTERGWLLVELRPGSDPDVQRQRHPVRPMVNLPEIDASGLTPEQLRDAMAANLAADLAGSVARQRVSNVSRDMWGLVDTASLHEAATPLLHYRIDPRFMSDTSTSDDDQPRGLARVGSLLRAQIDAQVPEADREAVAALATSLLREVAVELPATDDEEAAVAAAPVTATTAPADQAPAVDTSVAPAAGAPDAGAPDAVTAEDDAAAAPVAAAAADVPDPAEVPAVEVGEPAPDDEVAAVEVVVPAALAPAAQRAAFSDVLAEFDSLDVLGEEAS